MDVDLTGSPKKETCMYINGYSKENVKKLIKTCGFPLLRRLNWGFWMQNWSFDVFPSKHPSVKRFLGDFCWWFSVNCNPGLHGNMPNRPCNLALALGYQPTATTNQRQNQMTNMTASPHPASDPGRFENLCDTHRGPRRQRSKFWVSQTSNVFKL